MNKPDKHKFISWERVFKNGLLNVGRNAWLAIAAIAMMAITLTILLFLIVATSTLNHSVKAITDKIDVTVYLKDKVTPEQVQSLSDQLRGLPNVQSVSYTSKIDALEAYRVQNASNTTLLQAISETNNPLPASLNIRPRDTNNLQSIKDFLDQPQIADLYQRSSYSDSRKAAIDKIVHAAQFFKQGGITGIVVFVLVSALIIFNTIRMAIFNRREELTIMRLLGATTWYIRGPFVVETMFYGVIAAVLSVVVCWVIFVFTATNLNATSLGLLDIKYSHDFLSSNIGLIIIGQVAAGMLIGAISSYIATRRYLKFKSS